MIKLFCLPYAGSSASFYFGWKKYLNSSVSLVPVELSGRGRRFNEPFYESIPHALDDISRSIENEISTAPYMLFGHSMGSLLSFELYYKLMQKKAPLPIHMFLSGKRPPLYKGKALSHLPDDLFLEEIKKFGGTPSDFFRNEELLSIFLPILKADMRNVDDYQYQEKHERLKCHVDILYGFNDPLTPFKDLSTWDSYSENRVSFHPFKGNHFFIHDDVKAIVELINHRASFYSNQFVTKATM